MVVNLFLYEISFDCGMETRVAYVLANTPERARNSWVQNCAAIFVTKYPAANVREIFNVKQNWENQWISTTLIEGPFQNGFIIHNNCHIY